MNEFLISLYENTENGLEKLKDFFVYVDKKINELEVDIDFITQEIKNSETLIREGIQEYKHLFEVVENNSKDIKEIQRTYILANEIFDIQMGEIEYRFKKIKEDLVTLNDNHSELLNKNEEILRINESIMAKKDTFEKRIEELKKIKADYKERLEIINEIINKEKNKTDYLHNGLKTEAKTTSDDFEVIVDEWLETLLPITLDFNTPDYLKTIDGIAYIKDNNIKEVSYTTNKLCDVDITDLTFIKDEKFNYLDENFSINKTIPLELSEGKNSFGLVADSIKGYNTKALTFSIVGIKDVLMDIAYNSQDQEVIDGIRALKHDTETLGSYYFKNFVIDFLDDHELFNDYTIELYFNNVLVNTIIKEDINLYKKEELLPGPLFQQSEFSNLFENITSRTIDVEYKAVMKIPSENIVTEDIIMKPIKMPEFEVTFKDYDGTILETQYVLRGNSATAPNDPTRTLYIFNGWDKTFANVTSNLTITATYIKDNPLPGTEFTEFEWGPNLISSQDGNVLYIAKFDPVGTGEMYDFTDANLNYGSTFHNDSILSDRGITKVVIEHGVEEIGKGAFYKNDLTSVIIPNTVVEIRRSALSENNISSINIPNSVSYIDWHAFTRAGLTGNLIIPDSVENIGTSAFYGNDITSLIIGDGLRVLSPTSFTGSPITSISFGNSLRKLENACLRGYSSESIVFPPTITSIVDPFGNVDLRTITIGENVTFSKNDYDVFDRIGTNGDFAQDYYDNNQKAGTYQWDGSDWINLSDIDFDFDIKDVYDGDVYTVELDDEYDIPGDINVGIYSHGGESTPLDYEIYVNDETEPYFRWDSAWSRGGYDMYHENFTKDRHTDASDGVVNENGIVSGTNTITFKAKKPGTSGPWLEKSVTITLVETGELPQYYTVTFKDYDGTILKTQTVEEGNNATAPSDPSRTGYTFIAWNSTYSNITTDLTVTAIYEMKNEFTEDEYDFDFDYWFYDSRSLHDGDVILAHTWSYKFDPRPFLRIEGDGTVFDFEVYIEGQDIPYQKYYNTTYWPWLYFYHENNNDVPTGDENATINPNGLVAGQNKIIFKGKKHGTDGPWLVRTVEFEIREEDWY